MKGDFKIYISRLINAKIIFLLCFLWRAIPIFFMKSINISTDEFTIIGMAAHLAGLDWTSAIRPQYYYGYPMTFIYAPIFLLKPLLEYPVLLYQLCLFINALLGLLNTWVVYRLLLKLYGDDKSNKMVLWLTLIFSLATSSIASEKVLTNDTLLSVCFNLAIYLCVGFTKYFKKKNIINSVLLGAISLLAYAVNGRGIILTGMIIILCLIMKAFHKTYHLYISAYLLSISGFLFVHSKIKAYYVATFFTSENIQVANSGFGNYTEILKRFLSTGGGLAFLIAVIGLLYALTFSSYGFSTILLFVTVGIFISKKAKKQKHSPIFEVPCDIETYILVILCALFIFFSVGISILHFGKFYNDMSLKMHGGEIQNVRVDRMFYSRYTATIKPLLIVLGLYIVDKLNNHYRKKLFAVSSAFGILLCILFQFINAPLIDDAPYASSNSPELSIVLGNLEPDFKYGIIIAEHFVLASANIIIFMGIYFICYFKDKRNLFKTCFTFINIGMGLLLLTKFLIPRSEYYYNIPNKNIIKYISDIYKETSEIVFMLGSGGIDHPESLRINHFPSDRKSHCIFLFVF